MPDCCPHCGNDDPRLLERYGPSLLCVVCGKPSIVKT